MDDIKGKPPVLTRDEVRQLDRAAIDQLGMSGLVLMENAGRGAADTLCRLGALKRVVIVCGKGNNAGDGFVIARHLDLQGISVQVVLCCDASELRGDALANFRLLPHTRAEVVSMLEIDRLDSLQPSDWVVDALLGTGATGEPRPPFDRAIKAMNGCEARKLAIDISSGLDADTGLPSKVTFRANYTSTFVAAKPGLLTSAGATVCR